MSMKTGKIVFECAVVVYVATFAAAVWHLYDPERFGSISGIDVLP